MTKKSRIEIARDIVTRVKKEMQEPRMTESVRCGLSGLGLRVVKTTAANSAQA